jgi:hypothetical protein
MSEFLPNELMLGFYALEASLNLVRGILSLVVVRAASETKPTALSSSKR